MLYIIVVIRKTVHLLMGTFGRILFSSVDIIQHLAIFIVSLDIMAFYIDDQVKGNLQKEDCVPFKGEQSDVSSYQQLLKRKSQRLKRVILTRIVIVTIRVVDLRKCMD